MLVLFPNFEYKGYHLIDKNKKIKKSEKAILVGLIQQHQTDEQIEEYLDELAFLAETAGAIEVKRFTQRRERPDGRTFLGKGKLQEIKQYIDRADTEVDILIFDDELTGSQILNIEEALDKHVLDRSDLILDIFAARATTAQARTQVELAQYQYILPRLRGMWTHLERQGGGIGTRGPGETEIETDRRIIRDKVSVLKKKLIKFDKQGQTQRKERGELIRVSLVGYTNVGKSTIMRVLSKEEVFAENKLFATLDTTTRKVVYERTPFLLSDTVGFIRKLPHHLVESFKSTLDETREADILLHVVDLSHPTFEDQMNVVNGTLKELNAFDKPVIIIFNKLDLYEKKAFDEWLEPEVKEQLLKELIASWKKRLDGNCIFISAQEKTNIAEFRDILLKKVKDLYRERYPYKTVFYE